MKLTKKQAKTMLDGWEYVKEHNKTCKKWRYYFGRWI